MTENPWLVDSIQDFLSLQCPECNYNSKEEDVFEEHAIENHPLSFVIFGKTCKEEDLEPILKIEANLTGNTFTYLWCKFCLVDYFYFW